MPHLARVGWWIRRGLPPARTRATVLLGTRDTHPRFVAAAFRPPPLLPTATSWFRFSMRNICSGHQDPPGQRSASVGDTSTIPQLPLPADHMAMRADGASTGHHSGGPSKVPQQAAPNVCTHQAYPVVWPGLTTLTKPPWCRRLAKLARVKDSWRQLACASCSCLPSRCSQRCTLCVVRARTRQPAAYRDTTQENAIASS